MTFKKISIFAYITYTCLSFFTTQAIPQPSPPKGNIEKPITVIIPSYNNKDWYQQNLGSVYHQNYENYQVIYINDASPDDTGKLVQQYIKDSGQEHRTTLINNPKNTGALANIYKAVHTCDNCDIIVTLDGDDWLKKPDVLQTINNTYKEPNVWMTYGQYEELHYNKKDKKYSTKPGHCRQIEPNIVRARGYREDKWVASHLRTFYAGLFKQIKLKDFLENSNFFKVTWDLAFMIPMLEMCKGKYKFIEDTLYVYNCITPLNDFKTKLQQQLHLEYVIRAKEKYQQTKTPFKTPAQKKASVAIIAEHSPAQLYALLESISFYMTGIESIYVIVPDNSEKKDNYTKTCKEFENITLVLSNNIKSSLENILEQHKDSYVALSTDNIIVKQFVDLDTCVSAIEQTKAYGFYLSLGKNIEENCILKRKQYIAPHTEIKTGIYAWQFKDGECDWRTPNNLAMTLYKSSNILSILENIEYNSCVNLQHNFNRQKFDLEHVGLFFKDSKVVTIEPEKVDHLLNLFENGMKINIAPIFLTKNSKTLLQLPLTFDKIDKRN